MITVRFYCEEKYLKVLRLVLEDLFYVIVLPRQQGPREQVSKRGSLTACADTS